MASYRYMRSFIEQPDPTIMTFFRKRLDDYLGILENHLSRRSYVAGSTPTVADISMIGYLMFPKEEAGFDFAKTHPAIRAWLDRIAAASRLESPLRPATGQAPETISSREDVGWAKPTDRANARPMACPPLRVCFCNGGHVANAPLPTLQGLQGNIMDIGFIGLGKMGFPMARRLIEAEASAGRVRPAQGGRR